MLELLSVALLAVFSLWVAAAAGLALGLAPLPLILMLTGGYAISTAVVIIAGRPLRERLLARFDKHLCSNSRLACALRNYGVVGLALIAPVATGAAAGAALGMAFRIPPRRLVLWMTGGAALWSVALIVASVFSLNILG